MYQLVHVPNGTLSYARIASPRRIADRGHPGTEGFLDEIVASWVAPVADALVKAGADEPAARADARPGVAVGGRNAHSDIRRFPPVSPDSSQMASRQEYGNQQS